MRLFYVVKFVEACASTHTDTPAWPGPTQPIQLSTGRWLRGVWAGRRNATKPQENPKVCLAYCHATASGEGTSSSSGRNPEQPGWTGAFGASWANPLALSLLELRQSNHKSACVRLYLIRCDSGGNLGQKRTTVWMFGWLFHCCCFWPH